MAEQLHTFHIGKGFFGVDVPTTWPCLLNFCLRINVLALTVDAGAKATVFIIRVIAI
jgi:hypothetical protein